MGNCKTMKAKLAFLGVFAMSLGCRSSESSRDFQTVIQPLSSPAQNRSSVPNLFSAPDGKIYLSWIESLTEERYVLKFSVLEKNGWSSARTIAQGEKWFVNWADFPSICVLNNGALAAHWLAKVGNEKYAYAVKISLSPDGGNSWTEPITPHTDGTPTEHGFVSLLPWENGGVLAVWLDGRNMWRNDNGVMSIRSANIAMNKNFCNEAVLDDRVCDCCQTGAGLTPNGAIVAYRDRSENEIRDIAVARFENGAWLQPETLFNDGWEINGCPVNGPAVATAGNNAAIAWYTEAKDTAKVKIIFSRDGGKTFGRPIRVDDGDPMGRVSVSLLSNKDAVVCWMEMIESNAEVRIRRIRFDGGIGKSIAVTPTSATRASGFPRMASDGDELIFAWTKLADERSVLTAKMKLSEL